MSGAKVAAVLRGWRMLDTSEYAMQDAIAEAFDRAGMSYNREVPLTPRDRIDFMLGHVGVEVKVAGTVATVTRQLRRYAVHPNVDELVLVTTRVVHTRIHGVGVPLHVVAFPRGIE